MTDPTCPECSHPVASHDDYGCAKWLAARHGAKMCECGISKRELIASLCPTCGRDNDHPLAINCSNAWHLTGEDRIPEPKPWQPT